MWLGLETIFWIAVIVMAFRLFGQNRTLEARLRVLTEELRRLAQFERRLDRLEGGRRSESADSTSVPPPIIAPVEEAAPEPSPEAQSPAPVWARAAPADAPAPAPPPETPRAPERRFEWGRFIGLRLPIWLGAIALCWWA